jgi:hypothetical protein
MVRSGDKLIGLSTDTKPTESAGSKVRPGMMFIETDTKKVAIYSTDGNWYYTYNQSAATS